MERIKYAGNPEVAVNANLRNIIALEFFKLAKPCLPSLDNPMSYDNEQASLVRTVYYDLLYFYRSYDRSFRNPFQSFLSLRFLSKAAGMSQKDTVDQLADGITLGSLHLNFNFYTPRINQKHVIRISVHNHGGKARLDHKSIPGNTTRLQHARKMIEVRPSLTQCA